jgi:hypothetical protein
MYTIEEEEEKRTVEYHINTNIQFQNKSNRRIKNSCQDLKEKQKK